MNTYRHSLADFYPTCSSLYNSIDDCAHQYRGRHTLGRIYTWQCARYCIQDDRSMVVPESNNQALHVFVCNMDECVVACVVCVCVCDCVHGGCECVLNKNDDERKNKNNLLLVDEEDKHDIHSIYYILFSVSLPSFQYTYSLAFKHVIVWVCQENWKWNAESYGNVCVIYVSFCCCCSWSFVPEHYNNMRVAHAHPTATANQHLNKLEFREYTYTLRYSLSPVSILASRNRMKM